VAQKKSSMMTLDLRKSLVNKQDKYFTVEHQCQLLSIPKSTFYYQPIGIQEEDLKIMSIMDRLYLEDPTMGTRRYAAEVTKRGYHLGRQHAKTLMQLMGIAAIYPKPRTTVIDKAKYKYPYLLRGISINAPDVAWGIDISYIPMRYGFMYLTAIIDIYSKYIVGWSISNTMDATWVVDTLKQAVKQHGAPKYINSDQGSQFTSDEYTEYVKSLKETEISMDGKVMWSGKTGLEKSQIKPEIKHPGKNADHKPLSSIQTDPHSVGTTHIQKSPMLPLYNSLFSIMDLPLTRGSISGRRRGVGLSDYSILTIVP
jgi:putative transposase